MLHLIIFRHISKNSIIRFNNIFVIIKITYT